MFSRTIFLKLVTQYWKIRKIFLPDFWLLLKHFRNGGPKFPIPLVGWNGSGARALAFNQPLHLCSHIIGSSHVNTGIEPRLIVSWSFLHIPIKKCEVQGASFKHCMACLKAHCTIQFYLLTHHIFKPLTLQISKRWLMDKLNAGMVGFVGFIET